MFKPTHTLLLITRQVLARVDVTAGKTPQVRQTWLRPRFDSESIGTLVDATLRLGPRRAAKVWVLSSDFWTGVVSLPPEVTTALAGNDLEQSVALEAESYSGISAFDSRLGLRRLASGSHDDVSYWVTQIGGIELSEMEDAVRACGATWGGAAHPAVVMPPASDGQPTWQLVQAWGESTLASRGRGGLLEELSAVGGRIDASSTRMQLARWQSASPDDATTWISDTAVAEVLPGPNDRQLRVDGEAGLAHWAAAWTRSLAGGDCAAPVVRAEKRPMSQERQIVLAASLGLLAIAVCFGHYALGRDHLAKVDASIKRLETQKERLDSDKKALADLSKRNKASEDLIAKTQTQAAQLQRDLMLAQKAVQQQRNRWVDLVDALLDHSDKNSWVQRLEGKSKEAVIHGVAISDAAANRFASELESAARREGWTVRPASTKLAPNTLTEFTIALQVAQPGVEDVTSAASNDEIFTGTTARETQASHPSRSAR